MSGASTIVHERDDDAYLRLVGERVRDARARRGLTRRGLAAASGVSERYLAQLEAGQGNASILVLRQVAAALTIPLSALVDDAGDARDAAAGRAGRIALIGLRGAGKTTLGSALAGRLALPFVELDREIERESGVALAAIFDLYGPEGYRRLERLALDRVLEEHPRLVLATGGSIATAPQTFDRLLTACTTVWLRAAPAEHMERVVAQGDLRPMAGRREAMADLRRILTGREPLYRRADLTVDTTGRTVAESLASLVAALEAAPAR